LTEKHEQAYTRHNDNSTEHSEKTIPFKEGDNETREVGPNDRGGFVS